MMSDMKTAGAVKRYSGNPVLSCRDVPYNDGLVFNAGITRFKGRCLMIFRNDFGSVEEKRLYPRNGRNQALGRAWSDDGIHWEVDPEPLFTNPADPLYSAYDPRLTVVDGRLYMCYAQSSRRGTCGGVAVSDDADHWEVLSLSVPDNRNMVLFPERINGNLVRLERPFAGYLRPYPNDPFEIYLSESPDGVYWGKSRFVIGVDAFDWVNDKIGPASPPVKTPRGWLALIHGVDIEPGRSWGWSKNWNKRYQASLILLDPDDPSKVIGLSEKPVITPETPYERCGYRDQVIFPGGMIAEPDGSVKIYYGAADTVVAMAEARLDDLLDLCKPLK